MDSSGLWARDARKNTTKKSVKQLRKILICVWSIFVKKSVSCKFCKKENYFVKHFVKEDRKIFQISLYRNETITGKMQINILLSSV